MADELEPTGEEEIIDTEVPEGEEAEETEELVIEIDGEEPEAEETPLQKHLREEIRVRDRELADYRKAAAPKLPELGPKPTLESSEWDEDKFEADLTAWHDTKRKIESADTDRAKQAEVQSQETQRRFATYRARAAALPVKDFDEAEKVVIAGLPDTTERPFQGLLLRYTKDTEKIVYALAKHPAKLAALSSINDIGEFIIAVHDLERNLKVTTRKGPPPAEADTIQRGTAPLSKGASQKAMDAAIDKGDINKFRQMRKAQKQKAA